MKILVTGGAGFIGSALLRFLFQETDHDIVNVDKLTYAGNLESLVELSGSKRYKFYKDDVCDADAMARIFAESQPDLVFHLAAESHVDRSIDGPAAFIETNILGTYTLLETARQYCEKLPEKRQAEFRFHHVSTDEVFGDLEKGGFFTETTPYAPSSPYSASKAASDHLVRAWHRTYSLPVVLTNCSNNYGPYQFPEKLIPVTILKALAGKPLPVYGDGQQIRDWLYVDDHVKALYRVATQGTLGETYNIGGFNEQTNLSVVEAICEYLEELVPHDGSNFNAYKDLISFVTDRPGHDLRYAIDATKIKSTLDWTPIETFRSGLKKTVKWYLDNQAWCESVETTHK